ncbi:hypothetical protein YC2023_099447 [Brassica napus]
MAAQIGGRWFRDAMTRVSLSPSRSWLAHVLHGTDPTGVTTAPVMTCMILVVVGDGGDEDGGDQGMDLRCTEMTQGFDHSGGDSCGRR